MTTTAEGARATEEPNFDQAILQYLQQKGFKRAELMFKEEMSGARGDATGGGGEGGAEEASDGTKGTQKKGTQRAATASLEMAMQQAVAEQDAALSNVGRLHDPYLAETLAKLPSVRPTDANAMLLDGPVTSGTSTPGVQLTDTTSTAATSPQRNGLSFLSPTAGQYYETSYKKLRRWVEDSLDLYKVGDPRVSCRKQGHS